MIMMDPHKAVVAIIKKRQGASTDEQSAAGKLPQRDDGDLDPRHMAAEDIMTAFHSKDVQHLKEALGNFHDLHKMHSEQAEWLDGEHKDEEDLSDSHDKPEL